MKIFNGSATAVLALVFALACSPFGAEQEAPEVSPGAIELPRPDLERVESAVRNQLEAATAEVEDQLRGAAASPQQIAEALGKLGCLYHAYEMVSAAEECYRLALRLAPGEFRWHYYLAFLLQVGGSFDAAATHFELADAQRPDDLPTLLRLGSTRLELSNPEDAEASFRRALELDPTSAAAHQGLARVAAARGDLERENEHLRQALKLQPQASILHYRLAQSYLALGRTGLAERHLELRGNTTVSFPDPLVQSLDTLALGAGLHLTRAGVAEAQGRTDAALAAYREAVGADPRSFTARLNLGLALARAGDFEGARPHLERAVELQPGSAAAQSALGRLLAAAGDLDHAIDCFQLALEIDPTSVAAHLGLAGLLAKRGEHRQALAAYSRALELEPQNTLARLGRSTARLDLDEPALAAAELRELVAALPDDPGVRLRLGEALQLLGDAAGALEHFTAAAELGLEPDEQAVAELSVANLLAARGDLGAAIERYRAALAADPDLLPALFNLAGALHRAGDHAEAATHYERLLELEPDNEQAALFAAEELLHQGRFEQAVARFAALLAAEPTSAPLAHALARTLAACPERSLRDGPRAVELALAVMSAEPGPEHAETLAMALAEAGSFEEAANWQRELIQRAEQAGDTQRAAALRANLRLYESGESCCASP